MPFLKNVWYFAGWSEELPPEGMLSRTIAGESIVIWADQTEELFAFNDRCPHRMVPLSLGKNEGDGIRCAYHGLKFSGKGCIENPHGPISSALRPRAYPVFRRHDILWVWLGDEEKADPANIPDFSFVVDAPKNAIFKHRLAISANHKLLVDNILDLSHADFLHPSTLGGGSITAAKSSVREDGDTLTARWDMAGCPALPIFRGTMPKPDSITNSFIEVKWRPSGVMTLENAGKPADEPDHAGFHVMSAHIMTPRDASNTHYFYCVARDFMTESAEFNDDMAVGFYKAFADEDKPLAEAQQVVLGDRDIMEMSPNLMGTDKAAAIARKIYNRKLIEEQSNIK